jgi:hypothetical protein
MPGGLADPVEVGIPVGPGLPAQSPMAASWLGLDVAAASMAMTGTTEPSEATKPDEDAGPRRIAAQATRRSTTRRIAQPTGEASSKRAPRRPRP